MELAAQPSPTVKKPVFSGVSTEMVIGFSLSQKDPKHHVLFSRTHSFYLKTSTFLDKYT